MARGVTEVPISVARMSEYLTPTNPSEKPKMQNIALNKPAVVSSTCRWSTHEDVRREAQLGNDGKRESSNFFHTAKEFEPWWYVDLRGIYEIQSVKIINRYGHSHRFKSFVIHWSPNGDNWFELYRNEEKSPFEEKIFQADSPTAARFLRIQALGYTYLHLSEIEVFGKLLNAEDQCRILKSHTVTPTPKDFTGAYGDRDGEMAEFDGISILNDATYPDRIRNSLARGWYEQNERRLLGELLEPGDRLLEIGTAIGAVAMTAARMIGSDNVLTFDANPEIVEHARQNFKYNRLERINSQVGVLNKMVDYIEGQVADFGVAEIFWSSRIVTGNKNHDIVRTVKVPTFCLEEEIKKFGATCMICDIEGGEAQLLNGAKLDNIRFIVMETHYGAVGEKAIDEMIGYLIGQGFSLHLGLSAGQVIVLRRHT